MFKKISILSICLIAIGASAENSKPEVSASATPAPTPAPKKPAKGWTARLKGDAVETFTVESENGRLELKINQAVIARAKRASEWAARYGTRTPTQVREEFVKIADALEEAKGEFADAVTEREGAEKEIAFAQKEGADQKELQGLKSDLKKAQIIENKAKAKHDRLVKKLVNLLGEKGTIYLIPGKKIEEAVESFPGASFDSAKSTLKFKSARGVHRYTVQVEAGAVTSISPECGPDLWKSAVDFAKLADSKKIQVPTEDHLFAGVPCRN